VGCQFLPIRLAEVVIRQCTRRCWFLLKRRQASGNPPGSESELLYPAEELQDGIFYQEKSHLDQVARVYLFWFSYKKEPQSFPTIQPAFPTMQASAAILGIPNPNCPMNSHEPGANSLPNPSKKRVSPPLRGIIVVWRTI